MVFLYDCYLMANATESEWFGHQGQKYGNVVPCRVFSLLFPALIQISYYLPYLRDPYMPLKDDEVSEHVHGGHDKLEVLAIDHGLEDESEKKSEDEIEREDEGGGEGGVGGWVAGGDGREESGCIRLAVVKPASPNQILLIAESNSMLPYLACHY
ncbi:hypothetical protein Prudu_021449 [Prunus dulcis]|uniref:Uncharacterized protein n=1 Tax=Prunus dulcis TaxID=3755 RepID=A0A4Y1RZ17_PRUDU|nr:hypothetical protein Prudu_021449 [Prunus dulcis]